jgi:hypothetical protein
MLSGTAIKAVVAYISDYVSKISLKSYQMFASLHQVFEKESEMIGGNESQRDAARNLVRKMVNSMTAKMEIGSHMASMYLLGNPDHYASHTYVPFFWRSYVQFVRAHWSEADPKLESDTHDKDERVPLGKQDGQIIATSTVDDYRYRPAVYEHVNLFEWIQCSEKKLRTKKERAMFEEEVKMAKYLKADYHHQAVRRFEEDGIDIYEDGIATTDFDEPEDGDFEDDTIQSQTDDHPDNESDWLTDDDDDVIASKQAAIDESRKSIQHAFQPDHQLFSSHSVTCDFSRVEKIIPNFIGGSLPRADKGDRSFYCTTMLTLFKPWRSPADLKDEISTWDQTFKEYDFTNRQSELMKNFNVRYECNDARDDHYAAMKKKLAEADSGKDRSTGHPILGHFDDMKDDLDNSDYGLEEDDFSDEDEEKGPKTARLLKEAGEMEGILSECGWLRESIDGLPYVDTDRLLSHHKPRTTWNNIIKDQRSELTTNKMADMPPPDELAKRLASEFDRVTILPPAYFQPKSAQDAAECARIKNDISVRSKLNVEQARAFRIVTDHASHRQRQPLRMYLGGMGGTGKSAVFKAIIQFFKERKEEYRFLVLGPTGSTAALLNGSTYHSVFRIPRDATGRNQDDVDGIRNESNSLAAVNERLQGVDYILLDEISMVSCNDLQAIATQAAKARNLHDEAFGGLSMIVAGDFAQLPPMSGPSLYSEKVTFSVSDALTPRTQNAVLGKVLWHQFNTVVILRQNMRQSKMSEEDDKLRQALVNMRYGVCTLEDVAFLKSRVVGRRPNDPKVNTADVCNVAVITARNSQKDLLNELGARRFAEDTNQTLEEFCSIDRLSSRAVNKEKWKFSNQSELKKLGPRVKKTLWNSMPSTVSDFIPGKLKLCVGMPVMLRSNDATELCMTKGQEGVVVGWDSSSLPSGEQVLDTLFARLIDPPRKIQIGDLPDNVVPITRTVTHVTCLLPDDSVLSLLREQVVVLLNFGMTDYTAQGKSRRINVVELSYCNNHKAYYVALSRGTSAAGTIILQDFNEKIITSGITGHLRQELRELEVLDEITRLRFEGKLPPSVTGIYRRRLLRSFYAWKSTLKDPDHYHPALKWKPGMGPRVPDTVYYSDWFPSIPKDKMGKNAVVGASITVGVESQTRGKKRGLNTDLAVPATQGDFQGPSNETPQKQPKLSSGAPSRHIRDMATLSQISPTGFIWDRVNYSCAYDALFTVLLNIWKSDRTKWDTSFCTYGTGMSLFSNELELATVGQQTLEQARNVVRSYLHGLSPANFPYGSNTTSIDKLAEALFPQRAHGTGTQHCESCGFVDNNVYGLLESFQSAGLSRRAQNESGVSLQSWFDSYLTRGRHPCPACSANRVRSRMVMQTTLHSVPNLILVFLDSQNLLFDRVLSFNIGQRTVRFFLRGIIYGGLNHFTCRVVQLDGWVWFHDGITTGRSSVREFHYDDIVRKLDLHTCRERRAIAVIYAVE